MLKHKAVFLLLFHKYWSYCYILLSSLFHSSDIHWQTAV